MMPEEVLRWLEHGGWFVIAATVFFLLLVFFVIVLVRYQKLREIYDNLSFEHRLLVQKSEMIEDWPQLFASLANQALGSNTQKFTQMSQSTVQQLQQTAQQHQQQVHSLIDPIRKSLEQVGEKLQSLEKDRAQTQGELKQYLGSLLSSQKELRHETAQLTKALRTPTGRGQWGEMQLKRVVEMAGMLEHCDFSTQVSTDDGRLRPDMVVRLPGGKSVVVDAKTSLSAYLDALEAQDEAQRQAFLDDHARQIRQHIKLLCVKSYWEQFQPAPEFVVMFLPSEAIFSAALEKEPTLIEIGVREKVLLATPTTLIALLRAVSYGWRQENLTDNARKISLQAQELFKRLGGMSDHFRKLGRNLGQAVDSYNQTVGSYEHRVMVTARKFEELDPSLEAPELIAGVEQTARLPLMVAEEEQGAGVES